MFCLEKNELKKKKRKRSDLRGEVYNHWNNDSHELWRTRKEKNIKILSWYQSLSQYP